MQTHVALTMDMNFLLLFFPYKHVSCGFNLECLGEANLMKTHKVGFIDKPSSSFYFFFFTDKLGI